MKTINYSTSTFEKMIKSQFLYIDKTKYLRSLITKQHKGIYFFSRPRRSGKSLTISTLKSIFEGKKELFRGLAIYEQYDWKQTYPVIQLDLGNCISSNASELKNFLSYLVEKNARIHKTELRGDSPETQFDALICDLSENAPVVILIDEYDEPILRNVGKSNIQEIIDVLSGFYATLKNCNNLLRFVFITGVSRFSYASIFSGLNNLEDISMRAEYATMLGFTQKELEENFAEYIDEVCVSKGMERNQLLAQIAEWYGGYRFCEDAERVYNPMSIACFFSGEGYEFNNYWYSTATPSFLVKYAKTKNLALAQDRCEPLKASKLESVGLDDTGVPAIMLQTGYLTIKDFFIKDDETYYNLDFPNYEVKQSFDDYLVNRFIH